ncbi:concanavalin A-like lectin/glucanase [Rhizoclosmatium globosum]|uniref:Concanavalin A-like lectin/glucanase n=1 Tax=Rhizoclosmatium globosum TaxID=329046 RepID=A0A1Y2C8A2_9FUNG|nr:concanavalin A-like lectin/glucanase [Rhizoclosmatium globosum]|eukprot:ORY43176.1 concanavalin A-like lectin/glucanase [Rhizoclosmatium globosum]
MFAIKCWVSVIGLLVSFGIAGLMAWAKVENAIPKYKFCTLLFNTFDGDSINKSYWSHEFSMGGPTYNGAFDLTTDAPSNSYVRDGSLFIKPTLTTATGAEFFNQTLTDEFLLSSNFSLNLTNYGCMGGSVSCYRTANITRGTMLPSVMSARLTTKGKFHFKYGKGEIQFRAPKGDWLWPAIWMLPEDNVYGTWPFSGEIDLLESRGNDKSYMGGSYLATSSLHYGISSFWNYEDYTSYTKDDVFGKLLRRNPLSSTTHTLGWEWTPTYFKTWLDSPLRTIMDVKFDEPAFQRGGFPSTFPNGSIIRDPWGSSNQTSAPFDQDFFLVMDVAVGGTNGWFQEWPGSGKPWENSQSQADFFFHRGQSSWYPSWGEGDAGALKVHNIRVWGICD